MVRGAVLTVILMAAVLPSAARDSSRSLRELEVTAGRPLGEAGLQKTVIDSLALKESIALSMADILTFNSSLFVKNHGRATLSTVAFRGTSPSHTQVTWNGMRISSPMLGMTDFSAIPSFFVDRATLLHGTSSVGETGGGIGGLVSLSTLPEVAPGFGLQYVQGIGSFRTFDEFGRLTYGNRHWAVSTRAAYSSSPNDYKYVNRDKKINVYDSDHNIIDRYHPVERNRSGAFKDLHVLQEVYYDTRRGDRLGLNVWYTGSNRELPLLTTEYGAARDFENRQREHTLRAVVGWDHTRSGWNIGLKGGYIHTRMAYDYRREVADGRWADMARSRTRVTTFYGRARGEYTIARKWYFTADVTAHQHWVRSEDKNVILTDGGRAVVGYRKGRVELSGSLTARWRPLERLSVAAVARGEMCGTRFAPLIPALFVDALLSPVGNVALKASVSRNYRFPTLNDLYFLPGGNPSLRNERGVSYDCGLTFRTGRAGVMALDGGVTWFDSRIDDWIIWLPTPKGYFSPRNVKRVHAYGVEANAGMALKIARGWMLDLNGSYSWTPSVNRGDKLSDADRSVGKQLPYVPLHSASVTGRLGWRSWALTYKWVFYSERFTMSSNDYTLTGHLPPYFMNNITLEKAFSFRPLDMQLKLAVNNLFDEEYLSVLSRPMSGINFEFFISLTPKFKAKH